MKITTIKSGIKFLLYASLFIPLVIFPDFLSPFHFGKIIVFRSLIELAFALYIVLIWSDPAHRPTFDPLWRAFLFFTLAFTITTLTSIETYQSFWGTLERMGGLWTFWHYFAFFTMLISVIRTREEWFTVLKITVAVGILSAFYGFGQKTNWTFFIGSGQRARIFGTIGNAALFAGYQIINLFLALTLYFRSQNTRGEKRFFGFGVMVMAIAILMTAVRGSLLGMGVGFILFVWLYFRQYHAVAARRVLTGLLVGGLLLVGMAFFLRNTLIIKNSGYLSRVTDFSLNSFTVKTRFWAWQAGFQGWKETPKTILFGYGPENFNIPFSKHFNPKFFTGLGSETLFDRAHNMFVEVLVTMGLLGFLTYVWLILVPLRMLWRQFRAKSDVYVIGLIAMIVAYIIHNSFIFDTSANFIAFFTVLGFIAHRYYAPVPESKPVSARSLSSLQFLMALVLVIGSIVLIYRTNILQAKANYGTTRAIIMGWANDFTGSVARYKEVMKMDVPGKYEFRNRYAQYALETASAKSALPSEMTEALQDAIREMEKNAKENPDDYLPELYLSRLNILLGRSDYNSPYNDIALRHALHALDISPTFMRTYYEIAQAYLNKKEDSKAIEYFRKAAELNPAVGLSYWYWGAVELQHGNINVGLELVNKAVALNYGPTEQDYLKIINVYFQRQDFQNVARWFEYLIKLKPASAQHHASLAVAYSKIGKIDEAIFQAREAARLDVSFLSEAQSFIKSLGRSW